MSASASISNARSVDAPIDGWAVLRLCSPLVPVDYCTHVYRMLAEEAHATAKGIWKDRLQYRGAFAGEAAADFRFAAPGRERLVRQAEEVYWK